MHVIDDVHDIGKNLVGFMLECNSIQVVDLGTDLPAGRFVEAVNTHPADAARNGTPTDTKIVPPGLYGQL